MPRKKCKRIVGAFPEIEGFMPIGKQLDECKTVHLHIEEYETIRLLDYLGFSQDDAAKEMLVSRPTITRIYEEARRKVAKAFIEGREIKIIGGNYEFAGAVKCPKCNSAFSKHIDRCCNSHSSEENKFEVCKFCHKYEGKSNE